MQTTEEAASAAAELIGAEPERWAHTLAVVHAARGVAGQLPASDGERLIAAAYVHDIGYAAALVDTGLHHLDGARWLRANGGVAVASLVAHHTSAREEAHLRALDALADFPPDDPMLDAALTYCDVVSGPAGEPMSLDERIADVAHRYGETDVVACGLRLAVPRLVGQIGQVEQLLGQSTIGSG